MSLQMSLILFTANPKQPTGAPRLLFRNRYHLLSFSKGISVRSIMSEFRNGKKVLTRYREWPYKAPIDKSFELFKFSHAFSILETVYQKLGN